MAFDAKRVADDDPRRCQNVHPQQGQCRLQAVEGGTNCIVHGGASQLHSIKNKELRMYKLGQWQGRVAELYGSDQVKSLREEIGILRFTLETILNRCSDPAQILLHSSRISDLTIKIEKLVSSCHSTEKSMGILLDKSAILNFAGQIIAIIDEEISDKECLARVADRVMETIGTIGRTEKQENSHGT